MHVAKHLVGAYCMPGNELGTAELYLVLKSKYTDKTIVLRKHKLPSRPILNELRIIIIKKKKIAVHLKYKNSFIFEKILLNKNISNPFNCFYCFQTTVFKFVEYILSIYICPLTPILLIRTHSSTITN